MGGGRIARRAGGGLLNKGALGGFRCSVRWGRPGDSEGLGARGGALGGDGRRACRAGSLWPGRRRPGWARVGAGMSGRCPYIYTCASQCLGSGWVGVLYGCDQRGRRRHPSAGCSRAGAPCGVRGSVIAGGWGTRLGASKDRRGIGSPLWPAGVSALVSTLYKGAGVPLFFIMGSVER